MSYFRHAVPPPYLPRQRLEVQVNAHRAGIALYRIWGAGPVVNLPQHCQLKHGRRMTAELNCKLLTPFAYPSMCLYGVSLLGPIEFLKPHVSLDLSPKAR